VTTILCNENVINPVEMFKDRGLNTVGVQRRLTLATV
jgi:hypothetical protein